MSKPESNVYGVINVGRTDGTRFNRWYVDADSLDPKKIDAEYKYMPLQEGDVVVLPGVTTFRVVKDKKPDFFDVCSRECSLGVKGLKITKKLDLDKQAALCLMCSCGGGFFDKGEMVHLEEEEEEG